MLVSNRRRSNIDDIVVKAVVLYSSPVFNLCRLNNPNVVFEDSLGVNFEYLMDSLSTQMANDLLLVLFFL